MDDLDVGKEDAISFKQYKRCGLGGPFGASYGLGGPFGASLCRMIVWERYVRQANQLCVL